MMMWNDEWKKWERGKFIHVIKKLESSEKQQSQTHSLWPSWMWSKKWLVIPWKFCKNIKKKKVRQVRREGETKGKGKEKKPKVQSEVFHILTVESAEEVTR